MIRSQEVVEVVSTREVMLKPMLVDTRSSKKFTFDRAFDIHSKQHEVYHSVVAPYIEEVLAGFNCTVFAYGQTGTGKTYTMVGEEQPELSSGWDDDTQTGIIPRALNHLFDELRMTELEFSMRISYLELYNEELCDLLSTDDTVKIRIYDDVNKKGSVIVQGLEEIPVHSKDDVYKLLAKGQERRRTASTLMNAQSSRSHTIFSIIVHIKENGMDGEELLKIGKLNLVDLAGSENITKAGNEKGIRTRESVNINQSLLTLGRVITALVERTPHVPYRESKLTRLLQESLGGRTKTSIIATVSPGHKDFEETMSTLEYAHRAKNIQNKPEANQKLSKKTVIKEYTEEIDRLKRELLATRDKNGIYLPEETYNEMVYKSESTTKELNDKVVLIKVLKEDLAKKEAIFKEVSLNLVEKEEMLRRTEDTLCHTKHELTTTKRFLHKTKRRYAEKKVVLDRHIKTEEALTNQAKELIEVVETVQQDTNGLHDTIDRRKETDQKNQTVCEQFVDQLKNRMKAMEGNMTNLTQSCHQISSTIVSDWDKYLSKQDALQQKVRGKISELESLSASITSKNSSLLTSFRDGHSQWSAEQMALAKSSSDANERALESLRMTITANVQALKKTLAEQDDQQKALLLATWQACRTSEERNLQFCSSLKGILQDMNQLVGRFGESQSRIEDFVVSSKKAHEGRMALLMSMCEEIRAEQACLDRLREVGQEVGQTKTSVEEIIENARVVVDKNVEASRVDLDQLERNTQQVDEIRQEHKAIIEGRLQNNVLVPVESSCGQMKEAINQQTTVLRSFAEASNERWSQFVSDFEQHQSKSTATHSAQTLALQDKINSEAVTQSEFRHTTIALNKQLQRNITSYQKQTNANLGELTEQVDRFHREELTLYQPTGQTPVRKNVNYPKDIPMTSPHDRIIRRFWRERGMAELDLSTTITEDNEDVSLLCSSLNNDEIRNSTPLRSNVLDEDRKHFKDLQISNILPKDATNLDCEDNKENMETITEVA